jgi:myosin VI
MLDTDLVWARDPHEGYIQGKIGELGAHEYEIVPIDRNIKKRSCPIEDVFPSCEAKSDNDDNCKFT